MAANTVAAYRRDLTRYTEVLAATGQAELGQVDEADVTAYLRGLRSGDADQLF